MRRLNEIMCSGYHIENAQYKKKRKENAQYLLTNANVES